MNKQSLISIIGNGRVGRALKSALVLTGFNVQEVITKGSSVKPEGDIVFLCVPDSEIAKVAELFPHKKLVHTSGTLPSNILNSQNLKASFHPIQSFTPESNHLSFRDIYISLEGDQPLIEELSDLARKIHSIPIILNSEQKKSIHLAAVILCNLMTGLYLVAKDIPGLNNLPVSVEKILEPLVNETIKNIRALGPGNALTGPASRGDTLIIEEHLNLIGDSKINRDVYISVTKKILQYNRDVSLNFR